MFFRAIQAKLSQILAIRASLDFPFKINKYLFFINSPCLLNFLGVLLYAEQTNNIDNICNFDKKIIMEHEAIKLELIEWLTKLDDNETIEYLKIVKDSKSNDNDWWDDLSDLQKQGIEKGLNDIKKGRTISHDEVKSRYGL